MKLYIRNSSIPNTLKNILKLSSFNKERFMKYWQLLMNYFRPVQNVDPPVWTPSRLPFGPHLDPSWTPYGPSLFFFEKCSSQPSKWSAVARSMGRGLWNTACKKAICFWIALTQVCGKNGYVNQVIDDRSYISQGTLCFSCNKLFLCSLHLKESIPRNSMISYG